MKFLILTFIVLAFSFSAMAGKAKVLVIDENFDSSGMEKEFDVQKEHQRFNSLPDKDQRDQFFAGINQIEDFDEWEKDLFYMNLKSKSLDELHKKYPMFSRDELQALQEKR